MRSVVDLSWSQLLLCRLASAFDSHSLLSQAKDEGQGRFFIIRCFLFRVNFFSNQMGECELYKFWSCCGSNSWRRLMASPELNVSNKENFLSCLLLVRHAFLALALRLLHITFFGCSSKEQKSLLGDVIYHYIISPPSACLIALEIANRVEASIYVWRRRHYPGPSTNPNHSTTKSSWEMVRELVVDGDKTESLAERAENLLLCLKQRFPGLT